MKFLSRSGHQLDKVVKFLRKVGLDLVVTLPRSKKQFSHVHRSDDSLNKNSIMTSTFKQELKKPDSKTLKFPGEEKRKTNQFLESRSSRRLMSLEGRSHVFATLKRLVKT